MYGEPCVPHYTTKQLIHSGYRLGSLIPKPEIRIWEQGCLSVNVTVHVVYVEEATGETKLVFTECFGEAVAIHLPFN